MITTLLVILLILSLALNIFFGYRLNYLLNYIELYQSKFEQFKSKVNDTYKQLKELDDRQMFEKDDDVGFVFDEIVKLIENLNNQS